MLALVAVSIVLIVHNTAPWLGACIRSIADQTFTDYEVIIVDVASDLATKAALWRHAPQLPQRRVRTLLRNVGGAAAGNLGIEMARGKFVTIVDSDDMLPPGSLRALHDAAVETLADVTIGRSLSLVGDQPTPLRYTFDNVAWALPGTFGSLRHAPHLTAAPFYWGRLYRTELLQQHAIRMVPGRLYADRYFTSKALAHSRATTVIPALTYLWRRDRSLKVGSASITEQTANLAHLNDRLASFAEVESLFEEPGDVELLRFVRLTNLMRLFVHVKHLAGSDLPVSRYGPALARYADRFTLEEIAEAEFLLPRHRIGWYLMAHRRWDDLRELQSSLADSSEHAPTFPVPAELARVDVSEVAVESLDVAANGITLRVRANSSIVPCALVLKAGSPDRDLRVPFSHIELDKDVTTVTAPIGTPEPPAHRTLRFEFLAHGRVRSVKIPRSLFGSPEVG